MRKSVVVLIASVGALLSAPASGQHGGHTVGVDGGRGSKLLVPTGTKSAVPYWLAHGTGGGGLPLPVYSQVPPEVARCMPQMISARGAPFAPLCSAALSPTAGLSAIETVRVAHAAFRESVVEASARTFGKALRVTSTSRVNPPSANHNAGAIDLGMREYSMPQRRSMARMLSAALGSNVTTLLETPGAAAGGKTQYEYFHNGKA